MPTKWGTGDLFIVDTKAGEWSKLPTIEELKLGEPSKEKIDRVFNNAPETFDCKILNVTGFYIALLYGNSTYLRFPKKLNRSRKYRGIQKWFRLAANCKRRIKNETNKACELCIHSDLCEWYDCETDRNVAPMYYCWKHKKVCKGRCDDFCSYTEEVDNG